MAAFFGVLIVILGLILVSMFRVFREYERGVVFMLGRFWRVKGPGLVIIIPIIIPMATTIFFIDRYDHW